MKRTRGFSLLELMIVVTVIAILAALAITNYTEQVRKSKRSEAMQGLGNFQLQMEKYRSFCPSYAEDTNATNNCEDRNGDGDGADAGVDAAYPAIADTTSAPYTYAVTGTPTATAYVITATKKSSFNDPKCGNFIVRYGTDCAGNAAAGVLNKCVSSGDRDYCWRLK